MKRWLARALLMGVALACSDPIKDNPCPKGICTGGDSGGTDGAQGCVEAWSCTDWVKGSDGSYTRTCNDANKCGTTASEPSTGPVQLPNLDIDFYKCNVEPIVDRDCAMVGCHGTEIGRNFKLYARGRVRRNEMVPPLTSCSQTSQQNLNDMGTGTVMCQGWTPHTDGEWQSNYDSSRATMIGLTNPDDSDLLAQPRIGGKAGEYVPGQTYSVTATMTGEHLGLSGCGPYVTGNVNQIALTFEDDAAGTTAGVLTGDYGSSDNCPSSPPPQGFTGSMFVYNDCHAIVSNVVPGRTSWTFKWTAPAKGSGGVTMYWGAVDGDCMMSSLMDDVKVGTVKLSEKTAFNDRAPPHDNHTMLAMLAFIPVVGGVFSRRRKR